MFIDMTEEEKVPEWHICYIKRNIFVVAASVTYNRDIRLEELELLVCRKVRARHEYAEEYMPCFNIYAYAIWSSALRLLKARICHASSLFLCHPEDANARAWFCRHAGWRCCRTTGCLLLLLLLKRRRSLQTGCFFMKPIAVE